MKKHQIALSLFLCLCAFAVAPAYAGFKHLKIDPTCTAKPLIPYAEFHTRKDRNRIALATRFAAHLEEKGQDPSIISALYNAATQTDTDFELLLLKATMESDLGRMNVAAHSSARGVFQYIETTWLTLIKRYSDKIGYPHYANAIGTTRQGLPYIKNRNPFMKAEILAMRYDPNISALIKAYQIAEETDEIRKLKRGRVTATDHYIAHMMGLALAKEFYDMKNKNSRITIAGLNHAEMREAARLNRVFFYNGKRPLTAREAYKKFEARVAREQAKINAIAKAPIKQNCQKPEIILVKN